MKKINRMLGHWLCTLLLMPVMWSCTDNTAFHDLNDRIMARTAAGPIALSVGRWIEHILANN